MAVLLIYRRISSGAFSIERLFRNISAHFSPGTEIREVLVPYESRRILPRVCNILWATRQRADVIHITGDVHYVAFGLPRARTVLTIHDCVSVILEKNRVKRALIRWVWFVLPVRAVAEVVTISEKSKRELARVAALNPNRIRVIPNAIHPGFRATDYSFNRECPRVLQIGTKPNKNIPRLAEALQGMRCHLRVIGKIDSATMAALERYHIDYSADHDLTLVQLQAEYQKADLVAFVSTYEGFGLPILEAQASGRPVVTSNFLPMCDVAGNGAVLVDPFDPDSIREGVLGLVEDEELRMSVVAAGRRNVRQYDISSVAAQYEQLYERVRRNARRVGRAY